MHEENVGENTSENTEKPLNIRKWSPLVLLICSFLLLNSNKSYNFLSKFLLFHQYQLDSFKNNHLYYLLHANIIKTFVLANIFLESKEKIFLMQKS